MEVNFEKKYGFVYVLKNSSLPNWVKIGRTNNVDRRIRELNTGLPSPFFLHKSWVMNDEVTAEKICHESLANIRTQHGTEFFSVPTDPITKYYDEYELEDYPLDNLVDYIEDVFLSRGVLFEDAYHPQLMG